MSSRDIANLKQGLVAAWIPSLGSTGYRLVDRVGSNHGVLTGMDAGSDWVVSGGAGALDFDGVDDFVTSAFPVSVSISRNVTLSAWVRLQTKTLSTNGLVALLGSASTGFWTLFYSRTLDQFGFEGWDLTNNPNVLAFTPSVNVWYSLVGVCQGSTLRIYVNGIERATNTNTTTVASQSTFTIANGSGYSQYFNGSIDDVRVFNRALSPPEIHLLASERGIGFKRTARSAFAEPISYKPPKDKTYAAITRSQSDYDSLREGLVLAICPSVSGATGYRAPDVSGRGNHGTLTNMTSEDWVVSGGAGALDFDGTNDRVTCGSSVSIPSGSVSVSGWMYRTGTANANNGVVFSKGTIEGNANSTCALYWNETQGWSWFVVDGSNNLAIVRSNTVTSQNEWIHVCGVASSAGLRLYLNGVLANSTTGASVKNSTHASLIGGADTGGGTFAAHKGLIDDVRTYNRALTEPEIRRLASGRGVGLKPTSTQFDYLETREKTYSVIVKSQQEHSSLSEGLVGAWCPSLGATGYRLIDRSGYGNHGTLTNMTSEDWVVSGGAGALDFDGVNDYVDCGVNAGNLTEKSTFSVSAWALARQTGGANTFRGLISRAQSSPYPFSIRFNTSGSVLRLVTDDTELLGPTITANQWFHITVVLAPSSRKIYFNGNLVTESTASYSITANDNKLYIGTDYVPQSDRVWDGQVDDVRIYNRALTPPEIRLLASKRGIGLRSQKQTMFYQFPSGSKRRRILTGMT